MTELIPLGRQIDAVFLPWSNLEWDPCNNFETITGNSDDLSWVVCNQAKLFHSKDMKNLRPNPIIPQIILETELDVRLDRILSLFLKFVGPDLVGKADTAPLLVHVQKDPVALGLDHPERFLQLRTAIASQRVEDIPGETA